jgi:hypothetical protein
MTKAYISHQQDSETRTLREFLAGLGVTVLDSSDLSPSHPLGETTRTSIHESDMVFAVLNPYAIEVFFEIGIAFGMRKPVMLLVEPHTPVPSFAMSVRYLISGSLDSDLVRLGIKKFIGEVKEGASRHRKMKVSHLVEKVDEASILRLLGQINELRQSSGATVERFAADLIRATGVTALEQNLGRGGRGADLAVWSDALEPSLGNPILFEIKAGKLDDQTIFAAFNRLAKQVSESDARFGVLLYLDEGGRRFQAPKISGASVLSFELEDFARELLKKPLANALIERRNQIVHGRSD